MTPGTLRHSEEFSNRNGAMIVLLAVLLIVLCACTAFCIDIGWGALAKSELQNAADSAAAAGAGQLQTNYSIYSISSASVRSGLLISALQSATNYSVTYAAYNGAGDVSSLTMLPGDIQYGFKDASGNFQANYQGYPNTVQVLARRDRTANASLPLFFAPAIGTQSLDLNATASATIYSGLITSFDSNGGGIGPIGGNGTWGRSYGGNGINFNCTLLPLAFNINHWSQFLSTGASPDGICYTNFAGIPQIQVYPTPRNSPGNFGLLCIGPWTNANPAYSNWILNGPSGSDLDALRTAGSFPVTQQSAKSWKGSPGLRSSLSSDFNQIIGQPRLLPLFAPASLSPYQAATGSGSNTTYAIVGFVGVKVTQVSGNGGNLNISVQPCDVVDPTAVFNSSTIYPVGAAPPSQLQSFTYPAPKFTR